MTFRRPPRSAAARSALASLVLNRPSVAAARRTGGSMSPGMTFFFQFLLVLTAILIGIRRGGVSLGMIGGLGVAVLVFGFRVGPSEPPIAVMLIILAVVTASATLQVAGGLDYLVQLTERRRGQRVRRLARLVENERRVTVRIARDVPVTHD